MRVADVAAIVTVVVVVVAPQYYLACTQVNEDWTSFVIAVALPGIMGAGIFIAARRKVLLYGFLAYLWSVTDDNPVNLDSVFTWPEVTTGLHHISMEILLHALTAVFLILALRESLRNAKPSGTRLLSISLMAGAAFVLASVSVIPLGALQAAISTRWYEIDILGHLISLFFFYAAIRLATASHESVVLDPALGSTGSAEKSLERRTEMHDWLDSYAGGERRTRDGGACFRVRTARPVLTAPFRASMTPIAL